MKKYVFILSTLLSFLTISSKAQQVDSLAMYKGFGSTRFEYTKDTALYIVSPKQVLNIMKDDPGALSEFKKAKSNYSAAGIVGFVGGALIGYPIGTAIGGGQPEWGLAAGGAALILVAAIPLEKAFKRHAATAIDMYNKKHTAFKPRTNYYFSGAGVRFVIRF